jgi:hypothetical protein
MIKLSAANNDKMDVVSGPWSVPNREATRFLCKGCDSLNVICERCEFIGIDRVLLWPLDDDGESIEIPEAVGIEMSFHVVQNIVNSLLGCFGAGIEVEHGDGEIEDEEDRWICASVIYDPEEYGILFDYYTQDNSSLPSLEAGIDSYYPK